VVWLGLIDAEGVDADGIDADGIDADGIDPDGIDPEGEAEALTPAEPEGQAPADRTAGALDATALGTAVVTSADESAALTDDGEEPGYALPDEDAALRDDGEALGDALSDEGAALADVGAEVVGGEVVAGEGGEEAGPALEADTDGLGVSDGTALDGTALDGTALEGIVDGQTSAAGT
jgi:large repetitive protein